MNRFLLIVLLAVAFMAGLYCGRQERRDPLPTTTATPAPAWMRSPQSRLNEPARRVNDR